MIALVICIPFKFQHCFTGRMDVSIPVLEPVYRYQYPARHIRASVLCTSFRGVPGQAQSPLQVYGSTVRALVF